MKGFAELPAPAGGAVDKAAGEPAEELVSIILTTLNGARYLRRSVDSCLAQVGAGFRLELIVVDGGSSDGTLDILAEYRDPRLRLVHQPDNAGKLPGAINLGMAESAGAYLTWTQDDSWFEPNAISTMLAYLKAHPEVSLVYTDYWFVDEHGTRIRYQPALPPERILETDVIGQCFLFCRAVYETVGPQATEYFPVHEVPWRARLAKRFAIAPLYVPLMSYTLHAASLTGKIGVWRLQYMAADALLKDGQLDRRAHRRLVAKLHVDQAYDEFILRGHFRAFWKHVLAGMARDGSWLKNAGLWKLAGASLLPWRRQYRRRLLADWSAAFAAKQAALAGAGAPGSRQPGGEQAQAASVLRRSA